MARPVIILGYLQPAPQVQVVASAAPAGCTADYSAFSISQGATCPRAQGPQCARALVCKRTSPETCPASPGQLPYVCSLGIRYEFTIISPKIVIVQHRLLRKSGCASGCGNQGRRANSCTSCSAQRQFWEVFSLSLPCWPLTAALGLALGSREGYDRFPAPTAVPSWLCEPRFCNTASCSC